MKLFLPPAKSVLNRHLVAASWTSEFESYVSWVESLFATELWADDSRCLLAALRDLVRGARSFEILEGAAPLRFFAVRLILSLKLHESALVKVGPRLADRAFDDLQTLGRQLGAQISIQNEVISINRSSAQYSRSITPPVRQSSQFASALELSLWAQPQKVEILVDSSLVSQEFYLLSQRVAEFWSARTSRSGQWPDLGPDAASACAGILLSLGSLPPGTTQTYDCLQIESFETQPDGAFVAILGQLGFVFNNVENQLTVTRPQHLNSGVQIDLRECSDLAPVLAALVAPLSPSVTLLLPPHLNQKESKRSDQILLMQALIRKTKSLEVFNTHGDHRFAMAMAIAKSWHRPLLDPSESASVSKSYPGFLKLQKVLLQ